MDAEEDEGVGDGPPKPRIGREQTHVVSARKCWSSNKIPVQKDQHDCEHDWINRERD
jgi:hypothetical protein